MLVTPFCLFMICSIVKQLPFEVPQNAVREKLQNTSESSTVASFGVFYEREFWYWAGGFTSF